MTWACTTGMDMKWATVWSIRTPWRHVSHSVMGMRDWVGIERGSCPQIGSLEHARREWRRTPTLFCDWYFRAVGQLGGVMVWGRLALWSAPMAASQQRLHTASCDTTAQTPLVVGDKFSLSHIVNGKWQLGKERSSQITGLRKRCHPTAEYTTPQYQTHQIWTTKERRS